MWTASRRVLLAHAHALTLTYIYKDSDFGAKTDSSLHSCSRPRALHLHRVPRAASLLLSAHCIDADGDVNVGSTKSQRPPRLPPATNVLRTHTISLTHTHTHAQSSVDVVGLVLRNLRARYPRSHSRSSARDTHIPQNSRTNSFVCCVHVLRPLRSADRTYERRQAGSQACWNGTEGHSPLPSFSNCLSCEFVCVHVCLSVCVWVWAFLLISICLCCCLFQFFDLYIVHNVLVCTSSPRFPLLLRSSPLGIGPNSVWSSKTFTASACQHFFSLPISNSNSIAAPWLPWGRRTYTNAHACTHTHTHAHGYICMVHLYAHLPGICKCLILSLFAYPSNSSLPLSVSLFHCTLIARLISLSDFACGYLCMRILPSTALSVTNTHTATLSGNLSPHRPLPIGFCARARKSISNAFFAHFYCCCCCVAVDVRRLKQQKKKNNKKTTNLRLGSWNFDLQFSSSPRCSLLFLPKFICSLLLPLLLWLLLLCPILIHVVAAIS